MKNLINTYALTVSLQDHGKDYIDTFCPFVLTEINNKKSISLEGLKEALLKEYGFDTPTFSLKSILRRLIKKKQITKDKNIYHITDAGVNFCVSLTERKKVEQRINDLTKGFQTYMLEKGETIDEDLVINQYLLTFIDKNIEQMIVFINPDKVDFASVSEVVSKQMEICLIDYFKKVEIEDEYKWTTLCDIVKGAIISKVMFSENISEINKKLQNMEVFLDSNIVFSLMGLHDKETSNSIKELIDLLKRERIKIKIFDFTISEIANVLKGYVGCVNDYLSVVKVNTIYSKLKQKGFSKTDILELIANIEKNVADFGIEIETTGKTIAKTVIAEEERERLLIYKPEKAGNNFSIAHDLEAISSIKDIRGEKRIRKFEEARAIFLTSDGKLAKFDYDFEGHKDNSSIAEVILDVLLTNILWLKNPKNSKGCPVKAILSLHSKDLLVDKNVWFKFLKTLSELKSKKNINEKDISFLFYDRHIEEVLVNYRQDEADKISMDLLEKEIQNAKKKILDKEKNNREKIEAIEKENSLLVRKLMKTEKSSKEVENENEKLLETIESARAKIQKNARKKAKIFGFAAYWLLRIVFILIVVFVIYKLFNKVQANTSLTITLSIFLGWFLNPLKISHGLEKSFINRFYLFIVNRSGLGKLIKKD